MAVATVNTMARYVCQNCSSCSKFTDGHIDWDWERGCHCGGNFRWEPCTIVALYEAMGLSDWETLITAPAWARPKAYP